MSALASAATYVDKYRKFPADKRGYYMFPDICGDDILFVTEDDLR
jgi:tricorn protease-like protein